MGEVVQFRLRPQKDELAEVIAWIKPAGDWWTGRMQVELARHVYGAADYRRILAGREYAKEDAVYIEAKEFARAANELYRTQCLKQIFIPADCVRHLRWKQDWLRRHGGGTPETALAIARDEASLASRLQAVAGRKGGAEMKAVTLDRGRARVR